MYTLEKQPQAYNIDRLIKEDLTPERLDGWDTINLVSLSEQERLELVSRVDHINTGLLICKAFQHCERGINPVLDAVFDKMESIFAAYYLEDFFAPDKNNINFQRFGLAAHLFLDPTDKESFYIFLGKRTDNSIAENMYNVVSRPDIVFVYKKETNFLFSIAARYSRMLELLIGPGRKIILPLFKIFKAFDIEFGPQVISLMQYEQSLGTILAKKGYERIAKLPENEGGSMHVLTYPGLPPYFTTFISRNGSWTDGDNNYYGLPGYAFYNVQNPIISDLLTKANEHAFYEYCQPGGIAIVSEDYSTSKQFKLQPLWGGDF